mgnify:CR=1 FL=1
MLDPRSNAEHLFESGTEDANLDPWIFSQHCNDPFTVFAAAAYFNISTASAEPKLVRAAISALDGTPLGRTSAFALDGTVVTFSCWHDAAPDLYVLSTDPSSFGDDDDADGSPNSLPAGDGLVHELRPALRDAERLFPVLQGDGSASTGDNSNSNGNGGTGVVNSGYAAAQAAALVNLTAVLSGSAPLVPAVPSASLSQTQGGDDEFGESATDPDDVVAVTAVAMTCRKGRWHALTQLRDAATATNTSLGTPLPATFALRPVVHARCPAQCSPHPLERALPPHMRLHYSSYAVPSAHEGVLPPPVLDSVRESPAAAAVFAAAAAAADGKLDGISAEDLPGVGGGLIDGPRVYSDGAFAHVACRNAATSNTTARPLATYQCHASATGPGEWRLISSSVPATVPTSLGSEPAAAALQALTATLPATATDAMARTALVMCATCLTVVCDSFPEAYTSTLGLRTVFSARPIYPGAQPKHDTAAVAAEVVSTAALSLRGRHYPLGTVVAFSCPLGGLAMQYSTLPPLPSAARFECRARAAPRARAFGEAWCGYAHVECEPDSKTAINATAAAAVEASVETAEAQAATAAVGAGFRRGAWVAVETNLTLGRGVGLPQCVPSECLHLPEWAKPKTARIMSVSVVSSALTSSGLRTDVTTKCPAHYVSLTPDVPGVITCLDGVWTAQGTECRADSVCLLPVHQPMFTRLTFLAPRITGLPDAEGSNSVSGGNSDDDELQQQMSVPWRDADQEHYPLGSFVLQSCANAGDAFDVNGSDVVWRSCGRGALRLDPQRTTEVGEYWERVPAETREGDDFLDVLPLWNNVTIASTQTCTIVTCPLVTQMPWSGVDPVSQLAFERAAPTATIRSHGLVGSYFTIYCLEPGYEMASSHVCTDAGRWQPALPLNATGSDTVPVCPRRTCRLPLQLAHSGALETEGAVVTLSAGAVYTSMVYNGSAVVPQTDPAAPLMGDRLGRLADPRLEVRVMPGSAVSAQCRAGYYAADQFGESLPAITVSDTCVEAVQSSTGLTFAKWISTAVPNKVPAYSGTVPPDAIPSTTMKNFYCKPATCAVMTTALARQLLMLPSSDATATDYPLKRYQITYPTPTAFSPGGVAAVGARVHLRCAPGFAPASVFSAQGVPRLFDGDGAVAAQCAQPEPGTPARWVRITPAADAAALSAGTGGALTASPVVADATLWCEPVRPRCSYDNGLTGNYRFDFGPPSMFFSNVTDAVPFPQYNSVLHVKCKRRFVPAFTQLTCGADGLWVGSLPTCVPVACGSLPVVTYAGMVPYATLLDEDDGLGPKPVVPIGLGSTFWFLIRKWPFGTHVYYQCPFKSRVSWATFTTPEVNRHVNFTC